MVTLAQAKIVLRVSNTTAFDDEITSLINAGYADLTTAGVLDPTAVTDANAILLMDRAVKTYIRANFGQPEDYDRLMKSYNEQKGQLRVYTGATVWSDDNGQI